MSVDSVRSAPGAVCSCFDEAGGEGSGNAGEAEDATTVLYYGRKYEMGRVIGPYTIINSAVRDALTRAVATRFLLFHHHGIQ